MKNNRIGIGEDIHILKRGRPLILAGVTIPFDKGLWGHSDADVVYHAVSDALLGALSLGDIGKYYPDNDPKTEGMTSSIILTSCYELIVKKGYKVGNLDINILCQRPKLAEYILAMRHNLATILRTDLDQVSIKAGTNEGLDAIGKGKAIKAIAIVLLEKD